MPLLLTPVLVIVLMAATWLLARRLGHVSVIDVVWGLAFVAVALLCAIVGDGDPARRLLVLGMVGIWGLRLAWHIGRRSRGRGEDPRYVALLERGGMVRKVFLPQGLAIWFVSLPVQISADAGPGVTWVIATGVVVWAVGLTFEAVGDAQLTSYRKAAERPPVMDRGLWAWTRHPNYFGDACVWWGLWLAGGLASGWAAGLATVLCPAAMTFFIYQVTGVKLLERTMMQRPGYPAYAARTSSFVPLPPKRR